MFRITCMVEDSKLAKALRALEELKVMDLRQQVVQNAEADGRGGVRSRGEPTTAAEFVRGYVGQHRAGSQIEASVLKVAGAKFGFSGVAVQGALNKVVEAGELRRVSRGNFTVNKRR